MKATINFNQKPLIKMTALEQQTNDFITKLQNEALDKCVSEVYKNKTN